MSVTLFVQPHREVEPDTSLCCETEAIAQSAVPTTNNTMMTTHQNYLVVWHRARFSRAAFGLSVKSKRFCCGELQDSSGVINMLDIIRRKLMLAPPAPEPLGLFLSANPPR